MPESRGNAISLRNEGNEPAAFASARAPREHVYNAIFRLYTVITAVVRIAQNVLTKQSRSSIGNQIKYQELASYAL